MEVVLVVVGHIRAYLGCIQRLLYFSIVELPFFSSEKAVLEGYFGGAFGHLRGKKKQAPTAKSISLNIFNCLIVCGRVLHR